MITDADPFTKVNAWRALCGLTWDVAGRSAEAAEAAQLLCARVLSVSLAPRRRYVKWADLRKYRVTTGSTACVHIAVRGKPTKRHTDDCLTRIGDYTETDPESQERSQAHTRRREAEPDPEGSQAPAAAEGGWPRTTGAADVALSATVPAEPTSVKRATAAVAADEGHI